MSEIVVHDDEQSLAPQDRAANRLDRLTRSFAEVIGTIALMHRDEDWRFLYRTDGSAYVSLADLVSDVLGTGLAMARRYIQGARDFYLPLSQITVDGTSIDISSSDVRELGSTGLREVVDTVAPILKDVDDPDVSSAIIADALAEARTAARPQQEPEEAEAALFSAAEDMAPTPRVDTSGLVAAVGTLSQASAHDVARALNGELVGLDWVAMVDRAVGVLRGAREQG